MIYDILDRFDIESNKGNDCSIMDHSDKVIALADSVLTSDKLSSLEKKTLCLEIISSSQKFDKEIK